MGSKLKGRMNIGKSPFKDLKLGSSKVTEGILDVSWSPPRENK